MEVKNAKNRSAQKRESSDIRDSESDTRIMGGTSTVSTGSRNDQIGVSRENSEPTDTIGSREWSNVGITGKIVGQLIKETERQLAYYRTQVNELETRLQELHELTATLPQEHKIEKSE